MSFYRTTKTEIGKFLLQKGLITAVQLQEALALQRHKEKGKPLGQILIELGYLVRDDLCFVLAIQSGYPYIDIRRCLIDAETLSLIPEIMIRKYRVFPIDKIQDVVTIAMVNPLDSGVIEQIQEMLKSNIKVFLTSSNDLAELISRYFVKTKGPQESE
ncbi:MAG: hypothetical protein ABIG31_01600 [Candidatus Omnitrophota bacterium]